MPGSGKYFVGFDLGGTKMRAIITDEDFKILCSVKKKSKGETGPEQGLQRMVECVEEALAAAKVSKGDLAGVGFGLPGILDIEKGVILRLPNLGWSNVAISATFEKTFGVPVAIENDVNAGTYAEHRLGAGKGHKNLVGIFPGTGIGGGIIIDGRIYLGSGGPVGEIGHIVFNANGPFCACGARGCYEAYAGRPAIAMQAARAAAVGLAPALNAIAGADVTKIRSSVLAESIAKGDKVVEEIVREAARVIGHLACSMIVTLAPSMVVLGGGLVEAMPSLYLKECRSMMEAHPLVGMAGKVKLAAAQLADDAVALGGACLARDKVQARSGGGGVSNSRG